MLLLLRGRAGRGGKDGNRGNKQQHAKAHR
jgi:hypothetical protein